MLHALQRLHQRHEVGVSFLLHTLLLRLFYWRSVGELLLALDLSVQTAM